MAAAKVPTTIADEGPIYPAGAAIDTKPQIAPKQNATSDHFRSSRKSISKKVTAPAHAATAYKTMS